LGGGIAVGNGVALANKLDKSPDHVYVVVGDGECEEGSIWESCLFAGHHKLNNLTVILDRNNLQGCGTDAQVLDLNNLGKKFADFGFDVIDIDGHNFEQIQMALDVSTLQAKCIIANTVKGKGISFMENDNLWHYKNVNSEDYLKAFAELDMI